MSQYQPLIDYLQRVPYLSSAGYSDAEYLDDGGEGVVFTLSSPPQTEFPAEDIVAKFWRDTGEETSFEVWRDAPRIPILHKALATIHKATIAHLTTPYFEESDDSTHQYDYMGLTIIDKVQVIDYWPDDNYWQLPEDYNGLQQAVELCHDKKYEEAHQITTPGTGYILDALEYMCQNYDFAADAVLPGIGLTKTGKLVLYDLI